MVQASPMAALEIPVARTIEDVRKEVRKARARGQRIGLVPTMGALHLAHVKLIEACRREAGFVVVSIFVNPTQFGPGEDYERYPRTLEADLLRCAEGGAALVFAPEVGVVYPTGLESTRVEVPGLSDPLEGSTRPGHFQGVATVVLKLFDMVGPDLAFFGEKDYQQLLVIRRMVADLAVPVEVRSLPTVREPDGLALSSRNRYLEPSERRAAAVLHRAHQRAAQAVTSGERRADRIRHLLTETIESQPLARLDYTAVVDAQTLQSLRTLGQGKQAVALVAAWLGSTRLIDNMLLPD